MGEKAQEALKLRFDRRLMLEFHGARITSDAGLLAYRDLDGVLGLTKAAPTHLRDTRAGKNVQHPVVPLLRQSVYSRLADSEEPNDADAARSWTQIAPEGWGRRFTGVQRRECPLLIQMD